VDWEGLRAAGVITEGKLKDANNAPLTLEFPRPIPKTLYRNPQPSILTPNPDP